MKKFITILFILPLFIPIEAQDVFQKDLFSADVILKYRAELGLSAQQVADVKKTYGDHISAFNSKKWDLDAELVALDKMLTVDKVNEEAATRQLNKVMSLEEDLKRTQLTLLIQLKNKLNTSQLNKLRKLRTQDDMRQVGTITAINENPRMLLKVNGSENDDKSPLYVLADDRGEKIVPGVDNIDPKDIASVEVLKGEKAKEKYGDKGKNGVVIVKLKQ